MIQRLQQDPKEDGRLEGRGEPVKTETLTNLPSFFGLILSLTFSVGFE